MQIRNSRWRPPRRSRLSPELLGAITGRFGTRARAVMITDTAFYRYRHYHQPSDTPDKLAYPELAKAASGLFAALSELGHKLGERRGEARIRRRELPSPR